VSSGNPNKFEKYHPAESREMLTAGDVRESREMAPGDVRPDSREMAPGDFRPESREMAPGDFDRDSVEIAPGDRDRDKVEIAPGDLCPDRLEIAPGDVCLDSREISSRSPPGSGSWTTDEATGLKRSKASVATRPMPNGGRMLTFQRRSRLVGGVKVMRSSVNPSQRSRATARSAFSALS
jgi:hypothetical protein